MLSEGSFGSGKRQGVAALWVVVGVGLWGLCEGVGCCLGVVVVMVGFVVGVEVGVGVVLTILLHRRHHRHRRIQASWS